MLRRAVPTTIAVVISTAVASAAPPTPRVVAVIDATGDADGAALAMRIGAELHDGLAPIADTPAARALYAPLLDEDAAVITEVRASLDQAEEALAQFNNESALGAAATGETRLLSASPRASVTELLSNLVFTEGLARFPTDPVGTRFAFAAVHRLTPDRKLDPKHFFPEVIEAYEASGRGDPGTGIIDIQVDGPAAEIWIDGTRAGAAPAQVAVAGGIHFVSVTGDDAVTTGARVRVDAGQTATLHLTAARADLTTRIARMRRKLLEAPDDAARAAAIASIAKTVGTDAAVIVVRHGDALGTRIWRDQAPGLGGAVAFASSTPRQVLEPLVPPPPPPDDHPIRLPPPPPPPGPPWWKKTWVREAAAISAIVIVGTVATYAATRDPGSSNVTTLGFPK
jgi:hypothetical protein